MVPMGVRQTPQPLSAHPHALPLQDCVCAGLGSWELIALERGPGLPSDTPHLVSRGIKD